MVSVCGVAIWDMGSGWDVGIRAVSAVYHGILHLRKFLLFMIRVWQMWG